MPAVPPAMPCRLVVVLMPLMPVGFPAGMHGAATGRAELSPLRNHAPRDLRHIGNEIIAEPEGIARAKFAGIALGGGPIQTGKERDRRQRQTEEDETQSPHMFTPQTTQATPATTHPSGEMVRRRWAASERRSQIQSELESAAMSAFSVPRRSPLGNLLVVARRRSRTSRPRPR